MKKIIIFSLAYFPFVGGAEVALREVITRLKGKYKFTVVTARMKALPSRQTMNGIEVRRLGIGIQWLDKLLFIPLGILYGLFHSSDLYFALLENQSALITRCISFLKGKNCIINLQSGDTEKYMRRKLGPFYFLYNWVYGKKPKYVVLSNHLRKRAIRHGVPGKNVTIIPNGVDTKLFSNRGKALKKKLNAGNKKIIITTSRLTLKNAIDDLIKAFAVVHKSVPSLLVICGAGEDEGKLRKLAIELKIEKDVRFLGLINYNELPKLVSTADVFVRPSISEGFGNSFIEALSCGVPIIGTPVGGIPDFIVDKKTGLFCKVRNPEDLAKKIKTLLKNRSLSNKIVKNGQKMIKEKYQWSNIAKQFDEVFQKS